MKHQYARLTKEERKLKNVKGKAKAFSKYIYKLQKEGSQSNVSVTMPNRDATDFLERMSCEAARLSKFNKRCAITRREIALALQGLLAMKAAPVVRT